MRYIQAQLLLLTLLHTLVANADSLVSEEVSYSNVYIVETEKLVHIHDPADGKSTVLNKNNLHELKIAYSPDEERKRIRDAWRSLRSTSPEISPPVTPTQEPTQPESHQSAKQQRGSASIAAQPASAEEQQWKPFLTRPQDLPEASFDELEEVSDKVKASLVDMFFSAMKLREVMAKEEKTSTNEIAIREKRQTYLVHLKLPPFFGQVVRKDRPA